MEITSASVCVVTGASSGIGRAIAAALGDRGAQLVLCSRNRQRIDQTVGDLAARGMNAIGWACDVSDEAAVGRFADRTRSERGVPHVLINNAGLGHLRPLSELTTQQIDETLAVNVRGVFLVARAFLPGMLERGVGHIVNMASLAGRNGFVGGTAYAASKHAVLGFSKSLMLEVRHRGIRVTAVCPGSVDTPFFERAGMARDDLDRILKPNDVATVVMGAIELPEHALVSEVDVRPSAP